MRLNDCHGTTALYAFRIKNADEVDPKLKNIVWIEGKDDVDLAEELEIRFAEALDAQVDELDFFMDIIDMGITLDDIKECIPEKYEYSRDFMEEHGLI